MSTQRWTAVTVALASLVFAVLIVLAGLQGQAPPTAVSTASPSTTVLGVTSAPVPGEDRTHVDPLMTATLTE